LQHDNDAKHYGLFRRSERRRFAAAVAGCDKSRRLGRGELKGEATVRGREKRKHAAKPIFDVEQ